MTDNNSSRLNYDTAPGEYTYSENDLGKSASGVVKNGPQSERDPKAQREAGGSDRRENDQGGHLIAHSMGGRNDETNLDAQNANVNQIDQKHIENQVRTLADDPNNVVAVNVSNYKSVSEVPDATMYSAGVMNKETGKIDEVHLSFQNMSHAEQQELNDTVDSLMIEPDPTQYAGMTQEEIELSHEYADAADSIDMGLGKAETFHFSNAENAELNDQENIDYVGISDNGSEINNYEDTIDYVGITESEQNSESTASEVNDINNDNEESGDYGMDE